MSGGSTEPDIEKPRFQGLSSQCPIGVFDSGIGGLTVVRELVARLPGEDIVYFGDTARLPYGSKSAETITQFAVQDAEFLLGRRVKMIVVACHSASSVALFELKRRYRVPVLGVIEPGARALVKATGRRKVGVIGTRATIRSAAYERAIRALGPDIEIVAKPAPLLVPLAEEGWLEGEVAEAVVRHYLEGFSEDRVDALLLGCTHFPLLTTAISRVLGPDVKLVDSSLETAIAAAAVLEELGLLNEASRSGTGRSDPSQRHAPGGIKLYLSDLTPDFELVGARFLGAPIGEVLRASVAGHSVASHSAGGDE